MSVAPSSRCLFCKLVPGGHVRNTAQRQFHSTPSNLARRRPAFQNIRAVNLGLLNGNDKPASKGRVAPTGRRWTAKSKTSDQPMVPKVPDSIGDTELSSDSPSTLKATPISGGLRMLSADASGFSARGEGTQALGREAHNGRHQTRLQSLATVSRDARLFKAYTPREKQLLALKYTPQQLKALEASEKIVNPEDLVTQGRMRDDPMRIEYKDDYSRILPLIDFPVRAPDEDVDPGIRPLSAEETKGRFAEWYEKLSERVVEYSESRENQRFEEQETLEDMKTGIEAGVYPGDGLTPEQRMAKLREWAQRREGVDDVAEFERFAADPSNFFHSPRGLLNSQAHSKSDPIPRLEDPRITTEEESEEPAKERLAVQTGLSQAEIDKLTVKILVSHRVVNQTRMGKIQSIYYLSIAGNGKGMLGIGEGKSTEPAEGALKSRMMAIRNMKPIPRYENRTIYGEAEAKVGASIVKLSARSPGFGNRCQSLIFEMARAAGIRDLSARCLRSRNKMNVVKATYAALMNQTLPEDVAMARGRKMVDVRKVYYEGAVN